MNKEVIDTRIKLINHIFPDLSEGSDPDIERYFELRSSGRIQEALAIYHGKIRVRYPEDKKRFILIAAFRKKDKHFAEYQHILLLELADRLIIGIKRNVDLLTDCFENVNLRNMYKTLKAVETMIKYLPSDSDDALRALDRYLEFSVLLDYRKNLMQKVRFLTGEFFAQSSASENEEWDFMERGRIMEENRRSAERRNFFDLSRIEFEEDDIQRIEISESLIKKEDRVLAFCSKYWTSFNDPGLERLVFLYSRKYGTYHYDIFRVVKKTHARKYSDDEMLNMVSTIISSRYSYSIQGDRYMRIIWRYLKKRLSGIDEVDNTPVSSSGKKVDNSKKYRKNGQTRVKESESSQKKESEEKVLDKDEDLVKQSPRTRKEETEPKNKDKERNPEKSNEPKTFGRQEHKGKNRLAPIAKAEPLPSFTTTGSVSDRIKKLSRKTYDVYREIFLKRVRLSIRKFLAKYENGNKGSPENSKKAEDLVYNFIERNYANPYMDWENSQEKTQLGILGFLLPELDSIIEHCYKGL